MLGATPTSFPVISYSISTEPGCPEAYDTISNNQCLKYGDIPFHSIKFNEATDPDCYVAAWHGHVCDEYVVGNYTGNKGDCVSFEDGASSFEYVCK